MVHAKAYNVGQTAENYLIRRRGARWWRRRCRAAPVTFASGAGTDTRNYRVSCDLIAAEVPAFKPEWDVRAGIEQLIEEYRRWGLRLEDLTGPRHQRLKRIRALQEAGRLDEELRWTAAAG